MFPPFGLLYRISYRKLSLLYRSFSYRGLSPIRTYIKSIIIYREPSYRSPNWAKLARVGKGAWKWAKVCETFHNNRNRAKVGEAEREWAEVRGSGRGRAEVLYIP